MTPDPRLPVAREAIANIIGDECKNWMEPMRKCALALDPNDDDSCWCWQKARAVADALDELAHNEKVAKERAAATCPFDNRDHGLQPEDPCPVCGDMGISDAPWTGKCVSDKKTVIA